MYIFSYYKDGQRYWEDIDLYISRFKRLENAHPFGNLIAVGYHTETRLKQLTGFLPQIIPSDYIFKNFS